MALILLVGGSNDRKQIRDTGSSPLQVIEVNKLNPHGTLATGPDKKQIVESYRLNAKDGRYYFEGENSAAITH
jgi:hypothetical protein